MRRWATILAIPLLGFVSMKASACYTVYDGMSRILYQSDRPPVDMSLPIHETLPRRFPGGSLVFDESAECPATVSSVAVGDGGPNTSTSSPLLTNQAPGATRNRARVVPPRAASMPARVSVLPSGTVARATRRGDTVITEYRNPPVTIVRRGDEVVVSEAR